MRDERRLMAYCHFPMLRSSELRVCFNNHSFYDFNSFFKTLVGGLVGLWPPNQQTSTLTTELTAGQQFCHNYLPNVMSVILLFLRHPSSFCSFNFINYCDMIYDLCWSKKRISLEEKLLLVKLCKLQLNIINILYTYYWCH